MIWAMNGSSRRSLINTSKNSSLDCNFLFFFAPENFTRLRLILVGFWFLGFIYDFEGSILSKLQPRPLINFLKNRANLITCLKCSRASFFAFFLEWKDALRTRLSELLNNLIVTYPTEKLILWSLLISLHVSGGFLILSFLFCPTRWLFFFWYFCINMSL